MDGVSQALADHSVLVTGATGFVGRSVLAGLLQLGAKPVGWVRSPPVPNLDPRIGFAKVDLVKDELDPLLQALKPAAIIHCAGCTFAEETQAGKAHLFQSNLTATIRLISAVSRLPNPVRLVVVSSAAIWAPMTEGQAAIDETHPIRPVASYGVSKAAATVFALAEASLKDFDLAVAVPFNVIGPGQPSRLVPQVMIDQLRADAAKITVTAGAVRDWIDVRDVAAALIALCARNGPRGLFNIASGRGVEVADLLAALCRIGGWQPFVHPAQCNTTSTVRRSIGDPRRLMAATGWAPKYTLEESLTDMILGARP